MEGNVNLKDKAVDGRIILKWCESVKWIYVAQFMAQ